MSSKPDFYGITMGMRESDVPDSYDEQKEWDHAQEILKGIEDGDLNITRLMLDSVVEAADGCRVEPDGECPHGYRSPLLVLGLI